MARMHGNFIRSPAVNFCGDCTMAFKERPSIAALTVSEAIEREQVPASSDPLVPGSWINSNFDVWIGAPEDNVAWDQLTAARDFFAANAGKVS